MIQGTVAPGLEAVRDAFAANFQRTGDYAEVGAALCVYRGDEKIVDLWGGCADAAECGLCDSRGKEKRAIPLRRPR